MVTPNNGSTFGWRRLLHVMTSLQNLYATIMSAPIPTVGKLWTVTHTSNLIKVACPYYF